MALLSRSRRLGIGWIAALLLGAGVSAFAQLPTPPTFEVASVKQNTSDNDRHFYPAQSGGLVRLVNVPLVEIIQTAFKVPPDQLIGPDWIGTTRYDILA